MGAGMAMSRIGYGAALAWTIGVCATLPMPAIAGGDIAGEPVFAGVSISGGEMTEKADEAYAGVYYAFNRDISRDGFILRLFGTRGFYEYNVGGTQFDANYWQGDVMIGYQWVRGGVDVGVYLGVDYQDHKITPDDLDNELRGSETGFKIAADIETNDQNTRPFYFALHGSYSTAFDSYYALARVGRTFGRFVIGPEVWALGDVSGDAQRLGLFVSFDVPLGRGLAGTLTLSGGHQFGDDTDARKGFDDGLYGTARFSLPFGR